MRIQNKFIVMSKALVGKKPQLLNLIFRAGLNAVMGLSFTGTMKSNQESNQRSRRKTSLKASLKSSLSPFLGCKPNSCFNVLLSFFKGRFLPRGNFLLKCCFRVRGNNWGLCGLYVLWGILGLGSLNLNVAWSEDAFKAPKNSYVSVGPDVYSNYYLNGDIGVNGDSYANGGVDVSNYAANEGSTQNIFRAKASKPLALASTKAPTTSTFNAPSNSPTVTQVDKSGLLKYYQKEGVLGQVSSGELFNPGTNNNEAASLIEAQATFLALKEEAKNEGILGLGKTQVLSAREIAKQSIEALTAKEPTSGTNTSSDDSQHPNDSSLPLCTNTSLPLERIYKCQAPLAQSSCTLGRRLFAQALTPIANFSQGGSFDYKDFETQTLGKGTFRVGDLTPERGRCKVFTTSRTFIVDSPEAMLGLWLTKLVYKDYVRLSFKVENVPTGYYEGLLGVSLNQGPKSLSSSALGQPAFNHEAVLLLEPNGYLPPIIPLPKRNGKTVCYGDGLTTQTLKRDIWPEIMAQVPSKFKTTPFMLTIKIEVSVVGKGYAYADFAFAYDLGQILKVNDIPTSSLACLEEVATKRELQATCVSSYATDGTYVGAGPGAFRNPDTSLESAQGQFIKKDQIPLPSELTALDSSLNLLNTIKARPECRLWQMYYDDHELNLNEASLEVQSYVKIAPKNQALEAQVQPSEIHMGQVQASQVQQSQVQGSQVQTFQSNSIDKAQDLPACAAAWPQNYHCVEIEQEIIEEPVSSFALIDLDAQTNPNLRASPSTVPLSTASPSGSLAGAEPQKRLVKTYACTLKCQSSEAPPIKADEFLVKGACHVVNKKVTQTQHYLKTQDFPCEEFYDEQTGYSDNCALYTQNPNCTQIQSTCLDDDSARLSVDHNGTELMTECGLKSVVYRCKEPQILKAGDFKQEVVCATPLKDEVPCLGLECVSDELPTITAQERSNRGQALGGIGLMAYMQDDMNCQAGVCQIFTGQDHTCRCGIKGSFDCCSIKTQVTAQDYIRLSSYIMTLEAAAALVKHEVADFGSWSAIGGGIGGLISSELDSLIGAYAKTGLETVRSSYLQKLTTKTANLVEQLFGKEMRDRIFLEGAAGGATSGTTLHPDVLNSAQGLMQAYVAYKLAVAAYEVITACHTNEYETSMRLNMNSCLYLRSVCDHKLLGRCLVRKRHYCCYNSPLARIVMAGLKNQGYAASDCRGISVTELQNYDLGLIDFSEWNNMVSQSQLLPAQTSNLDTITGSGSALNTGDRADAAIRAQGRVGELESTFKSSKE